MVSFVVAMNRVDVVDDVVVLVDFDLDVDLYLDVCIAVSLCDGALFVFDFVNNCFLRVFSIGSGSVITRLFFP